MHHPGRTIPLNGIWQYQPGGATMPAEWRHTVPVPGLVDLATPACDWRLHAGHWHRTVFRIDAPGVDERFVLVIEQAMFGTEVWVNGRRAGGDIACYTALEFDITGFVTAGDNALVVRTGLRDALPAHSAAGHDQERARFIPGIWGDVRIDRSGVLRIPHVRIIPRINEGVAELRVALDAGTAVYEGPVELRAAVRPWRRRAGGKEWIDAPDDIVVERHTEVEISPMAETVAHLAVHFHEMHLWSPDDPFLYEAEIRLAIGGAEQDAVRERFGMREFAVRGRHFHLNGRRIRLRGGNIAFHRFLSDAQRGTLPWDMDWVKRVLVDIPKAHNMNFFRMHIGHAYNRWYDVADEHGMMLQDEWPFWTVSGSEEQIRAEFTHWLRDNANHPSIVIWDALNECRSDMVEQRVIPAMKRIDPTRPWEPADFVEQHPYIWSLCPVLPDRDMGFAESLVDVRRRDRPLVINEFLWWWYDCEGRPSRLMEGVTERWLGPGWTREEFVAHQSLLARELIALFRRMDADAVQPFVYLSNNEGPTAHWFTGDIADALPKPVLAAVRDAFAPFAVSIELWDRHFLAGETREVAFHVFNDHDKPRTGRVRWRMVDGGGEARSAGELHGDVEAPAASTAVLPATIAMPAEAGAYTLRCELTDRAGAPLHFEEHAVHVFEAPRPVEGFPRVRIVVASAGGEAAAYLAALGVPFEEFAHASLDRAGVVLYVEGRALRSGLYASRLDEITACVERGGVVVLGEPEFGVTAPVTERVTRRVALAMEPRFDTDKGGYDSAVHPADVAHPLWAGIAREHLRMFNGGLGGEMVSEHIVRFDGGGDVAVRASCGLALATPAVMELRADAGRIVVSRIQTRGRLMPGFGRRVDPVAQRYFLNLIGMGEMG